jgi:hypothetical protein
MFETTLLNKLDTPKILTNLGGHNHLITFQTKESERKHKIMHFVHLLVKRKAESKLLQTDLMCSEKVSAILQGAVKRLPSNTSYRKSNPFSLRISDIVQCFKIKQ